MWILSFFPVLYSFLLLSSRRKISIGVFNLLGIFFVILFSAIYGLRDLNSGADSLVYASAFEAIGASRNFEPGFSLWLKIVRVVSDNYSVFFFLTAVFNSLLVFFASKVVRSRISSELAILFLVIWFYSFVTFDLYVNGMRQGLGLSFAIVSVAQIVGGFKLRSILAALFASSMHISFLVIFLFIGLWLLFRRYKRFIFILLGFSVLFLIIAMLAGVDLFKVVIAEKLFGFISGGLRAKLINYSELTKGNYASLNFFGKLQIIIYILPIIIVFFSLLEKRSFERSSVTVFVCSGALFCTGVYLVMAYQAYSYRYLYLVSAFYPFLIISFLQIVKRKVFIVSNDVYLLSSVLIIMAGYVYSVLLSSSFLSFTYVF